MVLARSIQILDNFPSIAQVKEICDQLQAKKPGDESHGRKIKSKEDELVEKFPWPNSLLGLLEHFDDPKRRGLSSSGLKFVGITSDEAEFLYGRWKAGDWDNEWAIEIVSRIKTNTRIGELK